MDRFQPCGNLLSSRSHETNRPHQSNWKDEVFVHQAWGKTWLVSEPHNESGSADTEAQRDQRISCPSHHTNITRLTASCLETDHGAAAPVSRALLMKYRFQGPIFPTDDCPTIRVWGWVFWIFLMSGGTIPRDNGHLTLFFDKMLEWGYNCTYS